MNLYRVTVVRHVEEIAQIDVMDVSADRASAFVTADLQKKHPLLTADWQRTGAVIEKPHAVASEAA